MAKALIIKGANFSANKLDTIVFNDIPCTAISMQSTASIGGLGNTVTLVPTVTPSNTTDEIFWESNHPEIASVVNGVVTSNATGSATITATCGNHSASCTVTVSIPIKTALNTQAIISCPTSSRMIDAIPGNSSASQFVAFGSTEQTGVYPVVAYYDTGDLAEIYPYPIPSGAKSITVSLLNFACVIAFLASKTKSTEELQQRVRDSVKVITGETHNGGTQWSISSWTFDTRTITIPDDADIDSFCLTFRAKNTDALNNFNPSNISITFGY